MLRLLKISFQETKRLFTIGAIGVAIGAFMITFFLGLVAGIRLTVEEKIFPEGSIEVVSSSSNVLDTVNFLSGHKGSSKTINTARIETMEAIEGVEKVYPRLSFSFPVKAYGGKEIFGFEGGTDIVGDGIPATLVKDNKIAGLFRDYYPEDSAAACRFNKECGTDECCFIEEEKNEGVCRHPVPFVVSEKLIEIYNTVIAPAHNMVRLPSWTIKKAGGLRLKAVTGRSYQSQAIRGTPEKICLTFAGISKQAIDIGISVPIEYAKRWNGKYAENYEKGRFSSAVMKISQKQNLGSIIQELKAGGIEVKSKGREEMGFFIGVLNGIFIFISILMVVISSIGISHIFYGIVVERKKEIGLMRALGASKRMILNFYLAQGTIIGLLGGIGGIILAVTISFAADIAAHSYLPDFPFKPDSFFRFELWIILLAVCLSLLSCLAGAFLPARRASRQNPMEVLD